MTMTLMKMRKEAIQSHIFNGAGEQEEDDGWPADENEDGKPNGKHGFSPGDEFGINKCSSYYMD